jgi:hypothetical protein
VSSFVLSGYWGVRILGRLGNDKARYNSLLKEMRRYLNSFVPQA